jgi:TonB-linked SusC/RagA family outer membrane protein
MRSLFLIGAVLILGPTVFGQGVKTITLSETGASIKDLFKEINRQTGYEFVYDSKTLATATPITINVKSASLEEVLAICFKGQPMTYTITGNTIVVKPLTEPQAKIEENKTAGLHYVEGRVVDKSGGAIPGTNVVIRGTSEGTVTDAEGKYSIQVNESDLLSFSFIGFKRFETEVRERTIIDVTLEEEVSALKEVTINGGYYETTDELKTGSIVKVSAKDIEKQPVTSPLMALQGRVPGLEITPRSGTPGVAPVIRIRGTNSLRIGGKGSTNLDDDGNFPLYVVDGVPVNSTPISSFSGSYTATGYDPLSTLSPSSIESIEVLKDADATAIYGSRGANGVILITTKKKAKSSQPTSFEFSGYAGIGTISKKLDLLNTPQYLSMRKQALTNDALTAGAFDPDLTLWDQNRYTDWQQVLLGGTANISDVQAYVASGNENTTFRFGGGFHKETLIFPGDFNYKRASVQLSLNHKSSDNKFHFGVSANYGLDNNNLFNDSNGLMQAALGLAPNAPALYNPDGSLNWEQRVVNGQLLSSWTNPLSSQLNRQTTNTQNLVSSTNISYQIFSGASLTIGGGFTSLNNSEIGKYPSSAQAPEKPASGIANFSTTQRSSWIIEPKFSYSIKKAGHTINLLVGTTLQNSHSSINVISGQRYPSDALLGSLVGAGQIVLERDDKYEYKYVSVYSRLGYDWRQRYLINLTGRRDGSSRFGPGNRYGNFGAVGGAWVFSNEPFFQPLDRIINLGKIRASYGLTGSDQIGDYRYYELYNVSQSKFNGQPGFSPAALANSNFAWEVTNKFETAIELGFFENRLGLEMNWYRNLSSNQLVDFTLSAVTGFPSVLSNFPATVENSGVEGILRGEILSSEVLKWTMSLNISIPTNYLVKFDGLENSPYATQYKIGEPLSVRQMYSYSGINQDTGLYEFQDKNGDGLINRLDYSLQNPNNGAVYGGITNEIQYKGFELSFLFQFSKRNGTRYFAPLPPGRLVNQPTSVLNSWRQVGDVAGVQKFSTSQEALVSFVNLIESNYSIVDATFLRLKTVSLSYRLSPDISKRLLLQEAKIFLQAQNLFTITKYPGLDPETGNTLPPLRMITAGLQIKF